MRLPLSFLFISSADQSQRSKSGLTLLETLVTIGIFVVLVSISIPPITGWYQTYKHQESLALISDSFSEAKIRALASQDASSWTVRISPSSLVLVREASGSPVIPQDDIFTLPAGSAIQFQSDTQVTFEQHTAHTANPARLVVVTGNLSTQIDVFTSGALSFQ